MVRSWRHLIFRVLHFTVGKAERVEISVQSTEQAKSEEKLYMGWIC